MKRMITSVLSDTMAARGRIRSFRQEEEGGMIIFSLFMLVLILTLAGMAVDLMRFETVRAKLQGTLDRAVLAAADLDQTMPPADVVRDYFAKSGMSQFLDGDPIVDEGLNYRVVTVNAKAEMPMLFADLYRNVFTAEEGWSNMSVVGSSSAEERVMNVEVSLVLDVSGSMLQNQRINNLRQAAREFVSTVLANNTNAPNGVITISMIPYSSVVNPGTLISPLLKIDRTHNFSTCPLFDTSIFSTTALDLSATYRHLSHFSLGGSFSVPFSDNATWCFTGNRNAIIPVTSSEATLHTAIDDLSPSGTTAIDMGMKWAVALLDPSTRSMINTLASTPSSGVASTAEGRPYAYDQPNVRKVVVLMTDGRNTEQKDLVEPFKSELSPIWFYRDDANQQIRDVDTNEINQGISVQYHGEETPENRLDDYFYYIGDGPNQSNRYPEGFFSQSDYADARPVQQTVVIGNGDMYQDNIYNATWQDLYADRRVSHVNNEYLSKPYSHHYIPERDSDPRQTDYSSPDNAINSKVVDRWQADARLSSICEAARDQGIIIYTVALEAPSAGQSLLLDCASSPSHAFHVSGTDISTAFGAIASDIRVLRLTR